MKTYDSKKQKIHSLLSVLIIAIGIVLMTGKIYADSEPGAIPLMLIVTGAGWYFFKVVQRPLQHETG